MWVEGDRQEENKQVSKEKSPWCSVRWEDKAERGKGDLAQSGPRKPPEKVTPEWNPAGCVGVSQAVMGGRRGVSTRWSITCKGPEVGAGRPAGCSEGREEDTRLGQRAREDVFPVGTHCGGECPE